MAKKDKRALAFERARPRTPRYHLTVTYAEDGTPQTRFYAIEGLGGLGLVLVFLRHATGDPRFSIGFYILLAVLSFVVVWVFLIHSRKPFEALEFTYDSRIKRIYPGLVLLVFLTLGITDLFGDKEEFGVTLLSGSSSLVGLANYVARIAGTPLGGGPGSTDALYHLWAVSLMMQFFVFFPLFLAVVARLTRGKVGIMLGATAVLVGLSVWNMATSWTGHNAASLLFGFTTASLPMLMGAGVAMIRFLYETLLRKHAVGNTLYRPGPAWSYIAVTAAGIAAVVSLIWLAFQFTYYSKPWIFNGGYALTNLVIAILMMTLTTRRNLFYELFGFSVLSGFGRIGFAFYMVHYPILWFIRQVFPVTLSAWPVALSAGLLSVFVAALIHLFLLVPGVETEWKLSAVVPIAAIMIAIIATSAAPYLSDLFMP